MRKTPLTLVAFLSLLVAPALALAAGQATPEEARAMAVKAAAYLKSAGPDKAFADFSAKGGTWHDRDLYVLVENDQHVMVAHGANPGLVGKNVLNLKDPEGKQISLEVAAIKDTGWVNFKWQNPLTKATEPKTMYVVRVGENLVCVGAYVQ